MICSKYGLYASRLYVYVSSYDDASWSTSNDDTCWSSSNEKNGSSKFDPFSYLSSFS